MTVAMIDSGVEWIGKVPFHWKITSIKLLSRVLRGASPRPIDDPKYFDDNGEYAWVRIADVSKSNGLLCETTQTLSELGSSLSVKLEPGALFVSIAGTVGKPCLAGMKVCIHDGFVYFPRLNLDPKFLFWVFEAGECYGGLGKFGTQLNLNTDTIGSIKVAVPPDDEIAGIVRFIDRETAKIDALVEEQRRLIDLLKEKRQAVISHAVTKGLDPDVPMKDSGVEWLGKVPEHWEVLQVRRLITAIEQGYSPECFAYPAALGEWGILKSGCVNRGIYRESENKALPPDIEARQECEVVTGDLLMSRASGSPELIGSVAIVEATQGRILMSDKIFRLRLGPGIRTEFAYWMFASDALRTQIVNAISGGDGMANNLPQSSIKAFKAVLPPVAEQEAIAAHLKEKVAKHDALAATAEAVITLLQERRTALISAAVTGQIDLRSAAQTRDAAE